MKRPLEDLLSLLSKRNAQQAEKILTGHETKADQKSMDHLSRVWALLDDKRGGKA